MLSYRLHLVASKRKYIYKIIMLRLILYCFSYSKICPIIRGTVIDCFWKFQDLSRKLSTWKIELLVFEMALKSKYSAPSLRNEHYNFVEYCVSMLHWTLYSLTVDIQDYGSGSDLEWKPGINVWNPRAFIKLVSIEHLFTLQFYTKYLVIVR